MMHRNAHWLANEMCALDGWCRKLLPERVLCGINYFRTRWELTHHVLSVEFNIPLTAAVEWTRYEQFSRMFLGNLLKVEQHNLMLHVAFQVNTLPAANSKMLPLVSTTNVRFTSITFSSLIV